MSRQLDFFAPRATRPSDDGALRSLGSAMPAHVRFGTSSWTFAGWEGLVYVDTDVRASDFARRSLAEYARHPLFRTVGIDRTFHAPMRAEELAVYASQLPDGFRAVSKVWSEITTPIFPRDARFGARAGRPNPRFLDVDLFVEQVATPYAAAFASHAGPLVIEIPRPQGHLDVPSFERSIATFLERVPRSFDYAFELRDPKLLGERHFDLLAAHDATHVFNLWTRMPTIHEQLAMRGALRAETRVVARLMVPPGERYAELKKAWSPFDRVQRVDPIMRADVTSLSARCASLGCELYVLVNNKAEGCSPLTVRALAELLRT